MHTYIMFGWWWRAGGDSTSFLQTFSPDGDVRNVNVSTVRVMQDCLSTKTGYVW